MSVNCWTTKARFTALAVITFLGLLIATGRVSAQDSQQKSRSPMVSILRGPLAGRQIYANMHALLIGINEYHNLPKDKWLDYAVNDVTELRKTLIGSYGFKDENVRVLMDEEATADKIRKALASLSNPKKVHDEDGVLIYFSGHGATIKLQSAGDMGFLLPADAEVNLQDSNNAADYQASCIPMSALRDYLQTSPAKHILLMADSCYSGLLAKSRGLEPISPAALAALAAKPARQAITAGGKGEKSKEDSRWGHGAFTFKLLEELRARAKTEPGAAFPASDLFASLQRSVSNLNPEQTPRMVNRETEGEFIFIASSQPESVADLPAVKLPERLPARQPATEPAIPASSGKGRFNPKDGAEMVFIPPGEFLMGDDDQTDNPRHRVTLSGYWIYKNLVTVRQYKQFCSETNSPMPPAPTFNMGWKKEDHPIVNVSWNDAIDYCRWAGASLPTEAQWEKAARGTDGRKFPWGNEFDISRLWCSKVNVEDAGGTAAVGSCPPNQYGLFDMAGNVWQWCLDTYDANFWKGRAREVANPYNAGAGGSRPRILRGGSWGSTEAGYFRSAYRSRLVPLLWYSSYGFRCASGS